MLYEDKRIKEINDLKHFHDNDTDYVDYEQTILEKSLSNRLFKNEMMSGFLKKISKPVSMFFDNYNIIKNWRNYTVDKDYYKHKN